MAGRNDSDRTAPQNGKSATGVNALFELSRMTDQSRSDIAAFALENAILITRSTIGYIALVNEDETVPTMHHWSKSTMQECEVIDKPIVYPLEETGLWGEAVRQRRPIITNDYGADNPWKKGLPAGHVRLVRHMNIPVFDGGKIVAVAGVGNKATNDLDDDVNEMTLIMDGMWRIISRKRAEEQLKAYEQDLQTIVADIPAAVYQFQVTLDGRIVMDYAAGRFADMLGASRPKGHCSNTC